MSVYVLHPYNMTIEHQEELVAVREVFGDANVGTNLAEIPKGSIVVPRYRALPFGRELEAEVRSLGSHLINSYVEHRNIANLYNWVHLLEGITAPAYHVHEILHLSEGTYFVKGETNSIKNAWFTKAFAPNKRALLDIVGALSNDLLVGSQEIVIRPIQPFRQVATAVDGRPVYHERRVFTLDGKVLSDAWYWSSFPEAKETTEAIDPNAYTTTLNEAIQRVKHLARFIVIDLAENEDGSWQVVELNDGSMSGLSDNDPYIMWSNFNRLALQ